MDFTPNLSDYNRLIKNAELMNDAEWDDYIKSASNPFESIQLDKIATILEKHPINNNETQDLVDNIVKKKIYTELSKIDINDTPSTQKKIEIIAKAIKLIKKPDIDLNQKILSIETFLKEKEEIRFLPSEIIHKKSLVTRELEKKGTVQNIPKKIEAEKIDLNKFSLEELSKKSVSIRDLFESHKSGRLSFYDFDTHEKFPNYCGGATLDEFKYHRNFNKYTPEQKVKLLRIFADNMSLRGLIKRTLMGGLNVSLKPTKKDLIFLGKTLNTNDEKIIFEHVVDTVYNIIASEIINSQDGKFKVFYHCANQGWGVVGEVITLMQDALSLGERSSSGGKLLRAFSSSITENYENISEFYNKTFTSYDQDHAEEYRKSVISTNLSLFGGKKHGEITLEFLFQPSMGFGSIWQDNLKAFLKTLLLDPFKNMKRYHNEMYKSVGNSSNQIHQIFINKDVLDIVGYASADYGHKFPIKLSESLDLYCNDYDKLVHYLADNGIKNVDHPHDLQGRLLIKPTIFLDPKNVCIKTFEFGADQKLVEAHKKRLQKLVYEDLNLIIEQHLEDKDPEDYQLLVKKAEELKKILGNITFT